MLLFGNSNFSHFSDVSWERFSFVMSLTTTRGSVNSMASVFIYAHSLALDAEYEILVSHGRAHVAGIAQYCLTIRTHWLLGDQ